MASAPETPAPGGAPLTREQAGLVLQGADDAGQAPIALVSGKLRIGRNAAPEEVLPQSGVHGLRYGREQTGGGIGPDRLAAYLRHDIARLGPPVNGLSRMRSPPTVQVAEGTTDKQADLVVRVVQILNAGLPANWQLSFSGEPGERDTWPISTGRIIVQFGPVPSGNPDSAGASVTSRLQNDPPLIRSARLYIDPDSRLIRSEKDALDTIAHEFLHSLGRNHPDIRQFPDSIMGITGSIMEAGDASARGPDGHILFPLDEDALTAVYSRLNPGTTAAQVLTELGPWSDEALHFGADLGAPAGGARFGAAWRNGIPVPWAAGDAPGTPLAQSRSRGAGMSWVGSLAGFTPAGEPVAGRADLQLDSDAPSGVLDFSGLTVWPVGVTPAPGSGTVWGDGDLGYVIGVRGNGFRQLPASADAGRVTGAFFGENHEGMGGVLRREDLAAGFGGQRPSR